MKRFIRNEVAAGLGLFLLLTGCTKSPPANPAPQQAPRVVAKEERAPDLKTPKTDSDKPRDESPDAPMPPAPNATNPTKSPTSTPKEGTPSPQGSTSNQPEKAGGANELPPRLAPEGPATVVMTENQLKTCLVEVGDTFPSLNVVDAMGQKVSLPTLFGGRLTIVVFWSSERTLAREQFERMQKEIANRYAPAGVNVVAVNVGDSPDMVEKTVSDPKPTFPLLFDPEKEAFQKIATSILPRTYLIDKNGKIVWFDIEYSRGMLRDLDNAVQLYVREST